MNPTAFMALAFFGGLASICWSAAYAWGKWLDHRRDASRSLPAGAPAADSARLARIEAAVEELAVEMERVAEAQRYTARLLAERLPGAPAPAPRALPGEQAPRVVTPH